jgi:hypothetical protein
VSPTAKEPGNQGGRRYVAWRRHRKAARVPVVAGSAVAKPGRHESTRSPAPRKGIQDNETEAGSSLDGAAEACPSPEWHIMPSSIVQHTLRTRQTSSSGLSLPQSRCEKSLVDVRGGVCGGIPGQNPPIVQRGQPKTGGKTGLRPARDKAIVSRRNTLCSRARNHISSAVTQPRGNGAAGMKV